MDGIRTTQFVYVYVADVDGHASRARILSEVADQFYGDRTYTAEDPEGHQCSFAQHVRDVPSDELRP